MGSRPNKWLVDEQLVHERANWDPTPIPQLPMILMSTLGHLVEGSGGATGRPTAPRDRSGKIDCPWRRAWLAAREWGSVGWVAAGESINRINRGSRRPRSTLTSTLACCGFAKR